MRTVMYRSENGQRCFQWPHLPLPKLHPLRMRVVLTIGSYVLHCRTLCATVGSTQVARTVYLNRLLSQNKLRMTNAQVTRVLHVGLCVFYSCRYRRYHCCYHCLYRVFLAPSGCGDNRSSVLFTAFSLCYCHSGACRCGLLTLPSKLHHSYQF